MTQQLEQTTEQELLCARQQVEDLKRQLMQAQKLSSVGALASSITHEFNNILTTVINYAKMGLRHKDVVTREKAFEKILNAGQRASKITSGRLDCTPQQSPEPQGWRPRESCCAFDGGIR